MVKTTRRTIQGANLRQVIRPKIGKKVSLRQIIRDPLTKHTNFNVQNNFSLRANSINNKILSSTSHLSQYKEDNIIIDNIQNFNQELSSYNISTSEKDIDEEENCYNEEDRDSWESYNEEDKDSWESYDENRNSYNNEDEDFFVEENSSNEDISFIFKNQYDGLKNSTPFYGNSYFPNKSVMLMFIWYTKHMIGNDK